MKNKFLAVLLVVAMVCSVCACGSTKQESSSSSSEAVKEESKAESSAASTDATSAEPEEYVPTYPIVDEPITVVGLVVGADTTYMKDSRIVWDKVEEITGINIEWKNIESEALATYLAGNEWPDFFHCSLDSATVNDYGIIGGRFVNYKDYLDIMPNLAQTLKDYPTAAAGATQLNGEMYNLFKVSGLCSTATVARPHYRLDVLENAGITEVPTTVDEFYDMLVTLKEVNGVPGMILSTEENGCWPLMLWSAFGTLNRMTFDDDGTGTVVFSRTTDQTKHYYEFLNKLYEEELMNREWLTLDSTAVKQMVLEGKTAIFSRGIAQGLAAEDLKDGNWDYLATMAPLTSEYDSTQTLHGYYDYAPTCGMYINADSEYIEEICKMLDIGFATEEVVEGSGLLGQSFQYGFQGVNWWINEDGTYEQQPDEGYDSFSTWQMGALLYLNFGRGDYWGDAVTATPGNAQARQLGFVENVIPYQVTDHIFIEGNLKLTEDEQYVIDNKWEEIKTYYKKMEAEFITGATDIETGWDTYVATVEKMGIAEILEVYQAAYDRQLEAIASVQ